MDSFLSQLEDIRNLSNFFLNPVVLSLSIRPCEWAIRAKGFYEMVLMNKVIKVIITFIKFPHNTTSFPDVMNGIEVPTNNAWDISLVVKSLCYLGP